jgi:hypothetical protein
MSESENQRLCVTLSHAPETWKSDFIKDGFAERMRMLSAMDCGHVVSSLRVIKKLGEGTYGVVSLCEMEHGGRKVTMAVKETRAGAAGKQTFAEIDKEARLAYRMSKIGAGPKVYHLYYIKFPWKKGGENMDAVFQYIFMEAFDGSVAQYLYDYHNQDQTAQIVSVVDKSLNALRRHLEAGVKCYDVKPQNFVYRIEPYGNVTVRMIDFGFPHCDIGSERKCANEKSCKRLNEDHYAIFVCEAAQFLFMARSQGRRHGRAELIMKAAEKNKSWHNRYKILSRVLMEFKRNKEIRRNYAWYSDTDDRDLDNQFYNDLFLDDEEMIKAADRRRRVAAGAAAGRAGAKRQAEREARRAERERERAEKYRERAEKKMAAVAEKAKKKEARRIARAAQKELERAQKERERAEAKEEKKKKKKAEKRLQRRNYLLGLGPKPRKTRKPRNTAQKKRRKYLSQKRRAHKKALRTRQA